MSAAAKYRAGDALTGWAGGISGAVSSLNWVVAPLGDVRRLSATVLTLGWGCVGDSRGAGSAQAGVWRPPIACALGGDDLREDGDDLRRVDGSVGEAAQCPAMRSSTAQGTA